MIFKGTDIDSIILAKWIKEYVKSEYKLDASDIRFHGSRTPGCNGEPKLNSDIDSVVFVDKNQVEEEGFLKTAIYNELKIDIRVLPNDYIPSWIKYKPNEIMQS